MDSKHEEKVVNAIAGMMIIRYLADHGHDHEQTEKALGVTVQVKIK